MGDSVDDMRAIGNHKKRLRAKYGVDCPECKRLRPKGNPSLLLPQQTCRVDRYKDPRPELTDEQYGDV